MTTELTDSDISNGWTVVSSMSSEEEKDDIKEEDRLEEKEGSPKDEKEVENSNNETIKSTNLEHETSQSTHIEELIEPEPCIGSDSSSDIDVIDEPPEETTGALALPPSDLMNISTVENNSRQEDSFSKRDNNVPTEEVILPKQEESLPKRDNSVPKEEVILPKQEDITPQQEDITSQQEDITSEQERILLTHEDSIPQQEAILIKKSDILLQEDIVPKHENILPKHDDILPKEETFLPKEEDTLSKKEKILPMEEEILTKYEDILPKQETVLSKVCDLPKHEEPVKRVELKPSMSYRVEDIDHEVFMHIEAVPRREYYFEFLFSHWKLAFILVGIGLIALYTTRMQKDYNEKLFEIKNEFLDLQSKTQNVRDTLISEYETEKTLNNAFQKQVKELKDDNLKLKHILKEYADLLQERTYSLAEECQSRESETKTFYNDEINKLKEQINMLQFDNEELQKQLVRLRYGNYVAYKKPKEEKKSIKEDQNSDNGGENGNTTEKLAEELKQLHRDLQSEIDKLKKWNELFEIFSQETQKKPPHDKKKSWSWNDVKKGIKDIINEAQNDVADTITSFPNINLSEMVGKYVKSQKKLAENMLNSISHYFQVAQEKTQKILDAEEVKKEWKTAKKSIWGTFDDLSKKWSNIKKEFYNIRYNDKNIKRDAKESNKENPEIFDSYFSNTENTRETVTTDNNNNDDKVSFSDSKENKINQHPESKWYFKHNSESDKENFKDEPNSWMFERAASRAKLRQVHKDSPINWYFRRTKYNQEIDGSNEDNSFHNDETNMHYEQRKSGKWKIRY